MDERDQREIEFLFAQRDKEDARIMEPGLMGVCTTIIVGALGWWIGLIWAVTIIAGILVVLVICVLWLNITWKRSTYRRIHNRSRDEDDPAGSNQASTRES